jgi:hypothetical protein
MSNCKLMQFISPHGMLSSETRTTTDARAGGTRDLEAA